MEFYFVKSEDTSLVIVRKSGLHVFYRVDKYEVVERVDVFFGMEDYAFFLVVTGVVDGYEGEREVSYGVEEGGYVVVCWIEGYHLTSSLKK